MTRIGLTGYLAHRAAECERKRELLWQYHALLDIMPDLVTDIKILDEDQLVTYAGFVSTAVNFRLVA